MHKLIAVAGTLLLVALFAAACGGEDEPEGEDFATQANSICAEATSQVGEINLEGFEQTEQDSIDRGERVLPIREQSLADLEALEPPAEDAEAYDEFLAHRADQIEATETQLVALEKGDQKAIDQTNAENSAAVEGAEAAAAEAGLSECAFELPSDDAEAAADVRREVSTTADPATSCDSETGLVSEPYLEDGFGGVEACTKEQEALQKNPEEMPEDIEVSDTRGVDDVVAVVEYEDVGGKFDGEPTSATLYNADGEWKLYSIATLE